MRPTGVVIIAVNDHYYGEGSLIRTLAEPEESGTVAQQFAEHGDHLPGLELGGWVLGLRVR